MKRIFLLFTLLSSLIIFSQQKINVKRGEIILKNNQKIQFADLKYEDDQVFYYNLDEQKEEHLFNASYISINELSTDKLYDDYQKKLQEESGTNVLEQLNDEKIIANFGFSEGIYREFEDFDKKTPNENPNLKIEQSEDSIAKRFYYIESGDKLKRVFAVSYKGKLYIRIKSLMKMFDNKSKGQAWDGGDYYLEVKNLNNFMYMQDYFTSNASILLGGLTAGLSARRQKGIIYDEKSKKFHLFKNLDNMQEYIIENYPNMKSILTDSQIKEWKKDSEREVDVIRKVLRMIKH